MLRAARLRGLRARKLLYVPTSDAGPRENDGSHEEIFCHIVGIGKEPTKGFTIIGGRAIRHVRDPSRTSASSFNTRRDPHLNGEGPPSIATALNRHHLRGTRMPHFPALFNLSFSVVDNYDYSLMRLTCTVAGSL